MRTKSDPKLIYDVGMHNGDDTAYYLWFRVVAIEPNPETLRTLRGNIEASGASVIDVQPVACTESEATLDFFAAPRSNTGESSLSYANASEEGPVTKSYRVRGRPLDAIIKEARVSRVDAIKIDVEGAELLVLKGARDTLAAYHPLLVVEVIDRQLKAMGTSSVELTEFLRLHGYSAIQIISTNIVFAPENPVPLIKETQSTR